MERNKKKTQIAVETKSVEKSTLGDERHGSQVRIEVVRNGFGCAGKCSRCSGDEQQVDSFAYSRTVRCIQCDRCALIVSSPTIRTVIPLVDFHKKRGAGLHQRPLDDLSTAEELVDCLLIDRWPSIETIIDFGIDTSTHFEALQAAYWAGCNVYDLDRVLGDGRAITQLFHAATEHRCPDVRFFTIDDWWRCCLGHTDWVEEDA